MAEHRICSVPNCGKRARKRGWCCAHYSRWKRHGAPTGGGARRARAKGQICAVDGCTKPAESRGWCDAHYQRWRKHGDPLGGRTENGAAMDWLLAHLNTKSDECVAWPFARDRNGYGRLHFRGKLSFAHRVMCELAHGEPPTEKHHAAHSCGKGHLGCVNPKHLRWATRVENEADKGCHGTLSRGEYHPQSKLSAANVLEIRQILKNEGASKIAKSFGVQPQTISAIKHRKSWAWLE